MSEIALLKSQRLQEREAIRHNAKLKKLKNDNRKEYEKTRTSGNNEIIRMQDRFDSEKSNLKNILEEKLSKLRVIQSSKYMEEKKRLELEILNLKKTHNDKIFEIKQTQALEVERLQESHRKTIDHAREKFIKEKMKWQTMED